MSSALSQGFLDPFPFSPPVLDKEIIRPNGIGTTVELYSCQACYCLDPRTRKADYSHEECEGNGWLYDEPITTQIALFSQAEPRDFERRGPIITGSASAIFLSGIIVGHAYKIRAINRRIIVNNDVLIKGQKFQNGTSRERVRFKNIIEMQQLRGDGGRYKFDVDFRIGPDGRTIQWIEGGRAPAEGKSYTLRYLTTPEYLVIKADPVKKAKGDTHAGQFHADLLRLDAVRIDG